MLLDTLGLGCQCCLSSKAQVLELRAALAKISLPGGSL